MKPSSPVHQAVLSALAAFEKMVRQCQRRRDELKAELGLLRMKARILDVKDETHWLVTQFIVPRETEYASLEMQLQVLESRIEEVRRASLVVLPSPPAPKPVEQKGPAMVWLDTGSPHVLALTA